MVNEFYKKDVKKKSPYQRPIMSRPTYKIQRAILSASPTRTALSISRGGSPISASN